VRRRPDARLVMSSAISTASTISLLTVMAVKISVFLSATQTADLPAPGLILPAIERELAASQLGEATRCTDRYAA